MIKPRPSKDALRCLVMVLYVMMNGTIGHAQSDTRHDLSLWVWTQLYYNFNKQAYGSFQYQLRMNNNIRQFDASNFYFLGGYNLTKALNLELLYQYNTSYKEDAHTFYAGLTYRLPYKHFTLFLRTAYQHTRSYFSFVPRYDQPINEWRNRIRLRYKINSNFSVAVSAEPTLNFSPYQKVYFDKVRVMGSFITNINSYQSITLFYLYQPDIMDTKINYALGVSYQLDLPSKWKKYKKLFKPKFKLSSPDKPHQENSY